MLENIRKIIEQAETLWQENDEQDTWFDFYSYVLEETAKLGYVANIQILGSGSKEDVIIAYLDESNKIQFYRFSW